jgi:hypothetical protein
MIRLRVARQVEFIYSISVRTSRHIIRDWSLIDVQRLADVPHATVGMRLHELGAWYRCASLSLQAWWLI